MSASQKSSTKIAPGKPVAGKAAATKSEAAQRRRLREMLDGLNQDLEALSIRADQTLSRLRSLGK